MDHGEKSKLQQGCILMDSAGQLARTSLLFQTDLNIAHSSTVIKALMAPRILLIADDDIISSLAGQVAISTAAMLMARSGHAVLVNTPNAPLVGYQPPMVGRTFHEAILSLTQKLISDVEIVHGQPEEVSDIAFVFGNKPLSTIIRAKRIVSVSWTDWSAELLDCPLPHFAVARDWPIGAMGAAVLAAAEAVKIAARLLVQIANSPLHFQELFKPSTTSRIVLAPEKTSKINQFSRFDMISAGAVTNGFLYCLLRIPRVVGQGRVFDKDISDGTNQNRNMLLIPEFLERPKVDLFKYFSAGINIETVHRNFEERNLESLSDYVAVGVDDIQTRWTLARANAKWIGVGATSHFESMASVHFPNAACIACLHPKDEPQLGPTPTISFVSFLSGLMMAADFLRDMAKEGEAGNSRQQYLTALQINPWVGIVPVNKRCPNKCAASRLLAA